MIINEDGQVEITHREDDSDPGSDSNHEGHYANDYGNEPLSSEEVQNLSY